MDGGGGLNTKPQTAAHPTSVKPKPKRKPTKPKHTTPTQRSLKRLRDEGWTVAITERWNPFAKLRQDLFGFIDLLAFRKDTVLAVQTTSGANVSARVAKIKSLQSAALWAESKHRQIVVHGWAKQGERGKRKLWQCREVWV